MDRGGRGGGGHGFMQRHEEGVQGRQGWGTGQLMMHVG